MIAACRWRVYAAPAEQLGAPGYVGIYQFVAVSILTPFGFGRSDAIAYILMIQAVSYVLVALWGSIGFWHFRRKPQGAPAAIVNQTV